MFFSLLIEGDFELVGAIEIILDGTLVTTSNKNNVIYTCFERLIYHVLE